MGNILFILMDSVPFSRPWTDTWSHAHSNKVDERQRERDKEKEREVDVCCPSDTVHQTQMRDEPFSTNEILLAQNLANRRTNQVSAYEPTTGGIFALFCQLHVINSPAPHSHPDCSKKCP